MTDMLGQVGVRISGTVRLNEKIYCIRDKDHWASCPIGARVEDLVDEIEKLYNAANVYVCDTIKSRAYYQLTWHS